MVKYIKEPQLDHTILHYASGSKPFFQPWTRGIFWLILTDRGAVCTTKSESLHYVNRFLFLDPAHNLSRRRVEALQKQIQFIHGRNVEIDVEKSNTWHTRYGILTYIVFLWRWNFRPRRPSASRHGREEREEPSAIQAAHLFWTYSYEWEEFISKHISALS